MNSNTYNRPSPHRCHPHSHVCHRIAAISVCTLAYYWVHHADKGTYCPDRQWQCNWPHHSHRHNRDSHHNRSSRVCIAHSCNGIVHDDRAESLQVKIGFVFYSNFFAKITCYIKSMLALFGAIAIELSASRELLTWLRQWNKPLNLL